MVIFRINVPATNTYFGQEINLPEKTNDYEGLLLTSYSSLFAGNQLTFTSGSQGSETNWFNVPYNANTNSYEMEVIITLNKLGTYTLHTNDYISFQGASECN